MIADFGERKVDIRGDCYIAPTASVVGSVTLQSGSSVWFGAVIRGDCEQITLGENSNVQDCAVLHADPGKPLVIDAEVTIGHNATVHGCQIGECSLIGINAVVLNGAKIGKHCLIGANALVPEGMEIPDGSLVIGAPAKIKRALSDTEKGYLKLSAQHYAENGRRFSQTLKIRD